MPSARDPRADAAPAVLAALAMSCVSVRAAVDPSLLELARLRVATLLGNDAEAGARPWGPVSSDKIAALPSWPDSDLIDERERAALALTEQFVIDVTGVLVGPLAAAAGALGAEIAGFVQALYLLDVGQRAAMVLGRLFGVVVTSEDWAWGAEGTEGTEGTDIPTDPMAAIMDLLAATGRLQRVDPVVKELVRLRGARLHQCRRCQSVRSVAAINAGADEALLGADDALTVADLPTGTAAALALVDAMFVGPPEIDSGLVGRLNASYDAGQLVELVSYLVRNAANKIPVAFGVDDAIVDEGFEYQVIETSGETVTVDASVLTSD